MSDDEYIAEQLARYNGLFRWECLTDPKRDEAWAKAWKSSITVRILTGSAEYVKVLKNPSQYWETRIWKLGVETMNQLESEQYILGKGFQRV